MRVLWPSLSMHEKARAKCVAGKSHVTPCGEDLDCLRARFNAESIAAICDTGAGRGSDFGKNQRQGAWAERLLMGLNDSHVFVAFGPSDPTDPQRAAYGALRRQIRFILLLEGKRPDLLLLPQAELRAHPEIVEWSKRALFENEKSILQKLVTAAIEIKSSCFHFERRETYRRMSSMPALSITIKLEELEDLRRWQSDSGVPVLLVQAFVDALFYCSLDDIERHVKEHRARVRTDPKTGKRTLFDPIDAGIPRLANIIPASGAPEFKIEANGTVPRPSAWPAASLGDLRLQGMLKCARLAGRVG